ncbi:hypothetical protein M422DRAFT_132249, partial [Sphaerobolus stellatus SS14]
NTIDASTGFLPFQFKTGYSPRIIPLLVPAPADASTAEISPHEIIDHVHCAVQDTQDNLLAAKIHQVYHAPEDAFNVGDLVMLSTTNRRHNYKHTGKKCVVK